MFNTTFSLTLKITVSLSRCCVSARMPSGELHPHLSDSGGCVWPDVVAALLSALRSAAHRWSHKPTESSMRGLELPHLLLPILLVHCW